MMLEILEIPQRNLFIYGILLFLIFKWYRWRKRKLNLFSELGIPGPPPHFLFGNILELNQKGPFQCQSEWIQKYGKVVGFYHGLKPILWVADIELLRKIFIKDFSFFSDRPEAVPLRVHSILDHIIPASKIMDSVLINLKGEHWKDIRRILSATFSINKMKLMIPAVEKVTDVMSTILEEKSILNEAVNVHEMLQRLTLDIICAQAFAMDTDFQNKTDDVLFRSAETIFELEYKSKLMFFGLCFPELGIFAMAINFLKMFFANNGTIPPLTITSAVEEVIKQRRKDPSSRKPDLLQLLIDASAADTDETSQASDSSGTKGGDSTQIRRKRKHLTDLEIKSNALVVFLAGYETTSSALAFAFHFLVKYPEFQKKIQAEIDHLIKTEGELNYYTVTSLQQIERVLLETMRLYPPAANFVNRIAVTDVNYDDLYIPKGLQIDVPVYYMHHSPDYWPRPDVFDPNRFLPENRTENQTISYFAFGIGPRSCIGARLVHISTKVIMAKILQKFTVLSTDTKYETNGAVATKLKVGTLVPDKMFVKFKLRSV